jgi:hypothetical protein
MTSISHRFCSYTRIWFRFVTFWCPGSSFFVSLVAFAFAFAALPFLGFVERYPVRTQGTKQHVSHDSRRSICRWKWRPARCCHIEYNFFFCFIALPVLLCYISVASLLLSETHPALCMSPIVEFHCNILRIGVNSKCGISKTWIVFECSWNN